LGRTYIRAGKYIFFCAAGLILFSVLGCATFQGIEERHNARKSLAYAKRLVTEGSFNDALRENERISVIFNDEPPGDRALFNMGLIYAHQDNPERDYEKSRNCFAYLMKKFPESSLADESAIWVSILDLINMSEQGKIYRNSEIEERDKEISDLKQLVANQMLITGGDYKKTFSHNGRNIEGDEVLFNMGLLYANNENPEKSFKKSHDFFLRLIKEYPQSPLFEQAKIWLGVLNIIEKSKQVDIEIEKKKKALER
jgi:TolA-binding protein